MRKSNEKQVHVKLLSLLLVFCMMMGVMPMTVFAADPYMGEPTQEGYWYEYDIPKDKIDAPHLLDVSKMAEEGYTLSGVVPVDNYSNFYAGIHTAVNSVEITFDPNASGTNRFDLTFTKEGADPVIKELYVEVLNIEMNLALCEGTVQKDELKIRKDNSSTLNLYGFNRQILGSEFGDYHIVSDNEKVATVRIEGDNIIVDTNAIGTANISVQRDAFDIYYDAWIELTVVVTDIVPEDGSSDVVISFANIFDSFDMIRVGGELVVPQDSSDDGGKMTGYKDYVGDIGEYVPGSTNVILYKEFIQYLQSQKVTVIEVEIEDRPDTNAVGTVSTIPVEIRALQEYTVSFEAGDGTGTMEDVILSEKPGEVGVDYKLPESKFIAPDGYEFETWGVNEPQTGKIGTYDVGFTEKITSDITFTAQWKKVEAPVVVSPQTGDNSQAWLFLTFAVLSLGGIGVTVSKKKIVK